MAQPESGTDLTTRRFLARQMLERANAVQIYLCIVSAVAAASLIGCMAWLLI
jgi:hypothetical protein